MRTTTVILGAGHAGLAMSRCLAERSIDHVVLERGEVANSWRTERWQSLRLLTPNWQSRLPGYAYRGSDPHGFMDMPELIGFLDDYARVISAPVETQTTVTSLRRSDEGYIVDTDRGSWSCKTAVVATGACNLAKVPRVVEGLPRDITSITPLEYRSPAQLPEGGVLVVGASATGIQLARKIHLSGRPVTLSVGEHVRLPRSYRGHDIFWWMEQAGVLDVRYDEIDDLVRARNVPSPQLIGSTEPIFDLNSVTDLGIRLVGRVSGIHDGKLLFSGSLANVCSLADLKMNRLLRTLDEWGQEVGIDERLEPVHRFEPTRVDRSPPLSLDLGSGEIQSIVWCTGFRPDYSWLDVPVLDHKGMIRHVGGIVDSPGLYLMGTTFLRRRKSSFIHGAEDDARDLSAHLAAFLDGKAAPLPEPRRGPGSAAAKFHYEVPT